MTLRTATLQAMTLRTATLQAITLRTVTLQAITLRTAIVQAMTLRTATLQAITLRTASLQAITLRTVTANSERRVTRYMVPTLGRACGPPRAAGARMTLRGLEGLRTPRGRPWGGRATRRGVASAPSAEKFSRFVVPTYGRFQLQLERGDGNHVWDSAGRRYLDMGGGIAVNSLGHAHPRVVRALASQAGSLMHCSNLYLTDNQASLAERLVGLFGRSGSGGGKVFFCNSGAEANEALYKLARRRGQQIAGGSGGADSSTISTPPRTSIVTTINSFHGRTLGGVAATGQDKIKAGFGEPISGFTHVPYGDIGAMESAITETTAAVLLEGVQGEGGITPASPEYLLGLRQLCTERGALLLMDGVQCGHFRTGGFQSYHRILEGVPGADSFAPDACSMAKSLAAGFPMGAVWIAEEYADVLGPGSHGTTFGGNPLACAVAHAVLDAVEQDGLEEDVRGVGDLLWKGLEDIQHRHPERVAGVRGLGFMVGLLLHPLPAAEGGDGGAPPAPAGALVEKLHDLGLLTVPAGTDVVRLLPALNTTAEDVEECLELLERGVSELAV